MNLSEKDLYTTLKASISHVLDRDALFDFAFNEKAEYVYSGVNGSIIFNLDAAGSDWASIEARFTNDGWDTASFPGLLDMFKAVSDLKVSCVEFRDEYPLIKWCAWFTDDMFARITPLAYEQDLLSYNQLTKEEQQAVVDMPTKISPETMDEKVFFRVGNSNVLNIATARSLADSRKDEICERYESVIITPKEERIVLTVDKEKFTVSYASVTW